MGVLHCEVNGRNIRLAMHRRRRHIHSTLAMPALVPRYFQDHSLFPCLSDKQEVQNKNSSRTIHLRLYTLPELFSPSCEVHRVFMTHLGIEMQLHGVITEGDAAAEFTQELLTHPCHWSEALAREKFINISRCYA